MTVSMHRDLEQQDVVTGADGRFSFPGLTVGNYYYLSSANAPHGWVLPGGWRELRLDGSVANTNVPLRALRPLSESLRATLVLDRSTYPAGGEALVTVTLANTGARPLTGIHAACDRVGNGRDLDADWGELAYSGPGATIQPHQTRTFLIRATVRPITGSWGFLEQSCDFSQSDEYLEGAPHHCGPARGQIELCVPHGRIRPGNPNDFVDITRTGRHRVSVSDPEGVVGGVPDRRGGAVGAGARRG